ncbi:MAG: S-layer homology domain-containing protein, partial [Clostridiales bacterium]|nr:S-layer homology domain-containing protein [Clostridiales bacterium]
LATIIRRYAGVSDEEIKGMGDKVTFNDTKTHWAADEIAWAAENEIVKGYNDGEYFAPDKSVTRAEISAMLVRAADKIDSIDISKQESLVDSFVDVEGHWASSEKEDNVLDKARAHGLITGKATDSEGNNYFYPDENATRAEVATMLTRFDMDPMYYSLSNMQSILPTKDTRPCLQFKGKATVTIDAFNSVILPQFGFDSEKYTVVIPEYQLKIYEDAEEYKYMDPLVDKETGKIKHDPETGDILYDSETCGCNSLLCTSLYGGIDDDQSILPKIYLAIKNTKTGEMTKYSYYEYKMKKVLGDDEGYAALNALDPDTTFKIDFKTLDKDLFSNGICQALEIETTGDMPLGYPYRVSLADGEFEKLQEIFDALENKSASEPITINITLQNLSSMSEPAHGQFKLVIGKTSSPFSPAVDWGYKG